ncbi:MAG: putative CULlin protein 1 [Streblomastix strix]|uniref:Putative CULlin protein 1 n=1 Tax=Streblomastix strix TaxID=222440 RepID=A0A5J4WUV4_9EUKA|nr:MAG: putative CULlin protein 1 [Streblomastix strix]
MDPPIDDLDTLKDVNDAWTRYLKPVIDDIKVQIEQNPITATANEKNILLFTQVIQHLCQKLDLIKDVSELTLKIIIDYCNMEINLPLRSLKDEQFLQGLTQNWEKFKIFVKIVCSLFQYLDDNYFNATQHTGNDKSLHLLSLQQRAYNIFKEQVFNCKIKMIQSLILDYIDQERSGETINITLMKNTIDIFIDLDPTLEQFYNNLEIEFLQRARTFYQQFAQRSLDQDTIPDFMIKCETAFSIESKRIDNYMNKRTEPKIKQILDDELLKKNVEILIKSKESGFRLLLEHDRFEDLGRMYRLITHMDNETGIDSMAIEFGEHIKNTGQNLIDLYPQLPVRIEEQREYFEQIIDKDNKINSAIQLKKNATTHPDENRIIDPQSDEQKVKIDMDMISKMYLYVEEVLYLLRLFNKVYIEQFQGNEKFGAAFKNSFSEFLNRPRRWYDNEIEIHLAVYVDALMKTVEAQSLNKQIETRLDEIVAVLQYCDNKDIFLYEIVDILFERIIEQGNKALPNEVVEKAFIAKLKFAFRNTYTKKLDRILQDHDLQIEMQTQFKEFQQKNGLIPQIDLQTQVLQKYHYSRLKSKVLNIPENIQQALQSFEQFYGGYSPEREIQWLPYLGSVEVQVQFSSKLCNITMQPTQAVVLLQFADGAQKSVKDLEQILQMEKEEVKLNVESLMQNIPILIRAAEGIEEEQKEIQQKEEKENSELGDDERLKLNKELKLRVTNFRVHKPEKHSYRQFTTRIFREEQMDIHIVSIIKQRKRMNYQDLINLVIDRITLFRPSSYDVKKRVEVLMTKDFLKRNDGDNTIIEYNP